MAVLYNYMFRPLLTIFRLSSRELKLIDTKPGVLQVWDFVGRELCTCKLNYSNCSTDEDRALVSLFTESSADDV